MKWHHRFYVTAAQQCFLPSHAQSLNTPTQSLFIRRGQCQSLPMLGNEENDGDGDHTEYNGIVHQATVVPWLRNSLRIYLRKFWADIPDIPGKGKTITNSCYHYSEHMVLCMQTYDVVVYASGWGWTKLKHRTVFQPKTILKPRRKGPTFCKKISSKVLSLIRIFVFWFIFDRYLSRNIQLKNSTGSGKSYVTNRRQSITWTCVTKYAWGHLASLCFNQLYTRLILNDIVIQTHMSLRYFTYTT